MRRALDCFNPRAHAGRDVPHDAENKRLGLFQPTRPRGARRDQISYDLVMQLFQPTRPRGARQSANCVTRRTTCFNPRAHAGRDVRGKKAPGRKLEVSTHAPTRGATNATAIRIARRQVSTHAPTRGATPPTWASKPSTWFQPTRPRGARPCARLVQPPPHAVSTHAPTRGATARARRRRAASRSFNPRAHAGRDSTSKHARKRRRRFQPTRPRGARREALGVGRGVTVVSTHAPTRGATCTRMSRTAGLGKFQPTRPRGARLTVARPA